MLALPRGGVPVAAAVAARFEVPLDLLLVRKLGLPRHRELAMGAIASGGIQVLNEDVLSGAGVSQHEVDSVVAAEQAELERRAAAYRGRRPSPMLVGRKILLVDDGLATGATMLAAVRAARAGGASEVVAAVPVGAGPAVERLQAVADAVVCPLVPSSFMAVGSWYADFSEVDDESIRAILGTAWCMSPEEEAPEEEAPEEEAPEEEAPEEEAPEEEAPEEEAREPTQERLDELQTDIDDMRTRVADEDLAAGEDADDSGEGGPSFVESGDEEPVDDTIAPPG